MPSTKGHETTPMIASKAVGWRTCNANTFGRTYIGSTLRYRGTRQRLRALVSDHAFRPRVIISLVHVELNIFDLHEPEEFPDVRILRSAGHISLCQRS
jgi:hypothetical protein